MMMHQLSDFNEHDFTSFHTIVAFLTNRLDERETIEWALQLKPTDTVKRTAVLYLIDKPKLHEYKEPWHSAWRLIEESWSSQNINSVASESAHHLKFRIQAGDRSGALINAIVEFVRPRLKVEQFSKIHKLYHKAPKKPKNITDLFSVALTSGKSVMPDLQDIEYMSDTTFLMSLALALEAAVDKGLDIARRIGWDASRTWTIGSLYRVYYVPDTQIDNISKEPDKYHTGIAPSTKLLHSVVSRLAEISLPNAIEFVHKWELMNTPIHLRLWAALSRDARITDADAVANKLLSIDNRCFWDLREFPEIAELRSLRFNEFNAHDQNKLMARIRKRPPRSHWSRNMEAEAVNAGRLYTAVRELRRIEVAEGQLPQRDKKWLDININEFPQLVQMDRIDYDFMGQEKAEFVKPNPDSRYEFLEGTDRLKALESALSSRYIGWNDDPSGRASDWIRKRGNAELILDDFEVTDDAGAAQARVWEAFCWVHSPDKVSTTPKRTYKRRLNAECARVLFLIDNLPVASITKAINGITWWLSAWEKQVVSNPIGLSIWRKTWPIAVKVTEIDQPDEEEHDLNMIAQSSVTDKPKDLDTLNTPAGRLVGVFLAACPEIKRNKRLFGADSAEREMRNIIISTKGHSGLIARHRMIESLPYFLKADKEWTHNNLIKPLFDDNIEAITLWRAVAHQTRFTDVLNKIGDVMADRAVDKRLDRDTRQSLVFSLIVESLHAFLEQRKPVVSNERIQQMIRSLDDEVRVHGALAIKRFIRDVSAPNENDAKTFSPEVLFQKTASPFLQRVWPQERSLATPGVSHVLASIPAITVGVFAEAVEVIERFLLPFSCWSLDDFGFTYDVEGALNISRINNRKKADALLLLLDLSIGTSENSVVPYDLSIALNQIKKAAPSLAKTQKFRRLATAARRV